jgi:protein TonB
MSKVSVFDHGWIDLVFEGRNQSYGAYQLRKQDPKTTMLALFTGIALMCTLVSIPAIINYFKDAPPVIDIPQTKPLIEVHEVEPFVLPEKPKPEPLAEKPAAAQPQSAQPTIAYKPFEAATNPDPADIPTTAQVLASNPAATTTTGTGTQIVIDPAVTPGGPGGTGTSINEGDRVENFVDVAPVFPGGLEAFYKKVAGQVVTSGVDSKMTLKIFVSFVVEKDGTLTAIKAVRDPGYGMGAEAVRVLKSIKIKWTPGMKAGKPVRTAYNLPITVNVN